MKWMSRVLILISIFFFSTLSFSITPSEELRTATQVVSHLLPVKNIKNLPKEFQANFDQEVTLEGPLEIRVVDYKDKKTADMQYLIIENGKTYYLYFTDKLTKNLKTGDIIKVKKGYQFSRTKHVSDVVVEPSEIEVVQENKAIPSSLGPQSTVLIGVNYQDAPNNRPMTLDEMQAVFNDVSNMYKESSYQQTTVVGKVLGWYTLAINSTDSCQTLLDNIGPMAEAAAIAAGEDLSSYKHRMYLFPVNTDCGWLGLGTIGTPANGYSSVWINESLDRKVMGHELGHNLGLLHAKYLNCPNLVENDTCTSVEYGDNSDIMGIMNPSHFNAYHKDVLGWLNYGVSPPITTITKSGTYFIEPYETTSTNPKALKILKQVLPDGSSDYYYVEFRQNIGYDSVLYNCTYGLPCDFTKGVLIHRGNSVNVNSSYIIDMTPNDTNDNLNFLVALLPGQSFTNPNAANGGIAITLDSISPSGATVKVFVGGTTPICERNIHTLTISPTGTQWINAGQSLSYDVTLTNNDSQACGSSNFMLSTVVSNKLLKTSVDKKNVNLGPNTSHTFKLTVSASNKIAPGVYDVAVNVTNKGKTASVTANVGINS